MKFRILAIATLFASLLGSATLKAETPMIDGAYLYGHTQMVYNDIYLSEGHGAAVAVSGTGHFRVRVYDYNDNLITHKTFKNDTCVLSWIALRDANFYVTVENLSNDATRYGIALVRK